jgi:hypothetical protein
VPPVYTLGGIGAGFSGPDRQPHERSCLPVYRSSPGPAYTIEVSRRDIFAVKCYRPLSNYPINRYGRGDDHNRPQHSEPPPSNARQGNLHVRYQPTTPRSQLSQF